MPTLDFKGKQFIYGHHPHHPRPHRKNKYSKLLKRYNKNY